MTRVTADPDRCTSLACGKCGQKCLIAASLTMIASSFLVMVVFWCTDFFSNFLVSTLVVTEDSEMFKWWVEPPIRAAYNIRIFNYTNIDEFMSGDAAKLKVREVGPYVYRETLTRVNTQFYPNGTLSFQERRSFQWEGGSPDDDMVVVPNVPLLSAMAFARDKPWGVQFLLNVAISAFTPKTFLTLPVGEFLWGYDDQLYTRAKDVLDLIGHDVTMEKFGVLAMKQGVSKDVITMHTGQGNISKMGMIDRVNGVSKRNIWGDDSCDKVYGSAGYVYPPDMYRDPKKPLDIYAADMCRTFKLDRVGHGSSYGIPTLSYKPPADGFDSSPDKDYCFCPKASTNDLSNRTCAPNGIFNVSACAFNTPMVASFPHFFGGEPSLFSKIEGLNPKAELHQSHLEIHPRLGLLIGGHSRIQLNIEARKATGVPFLQNLSHGQILPILWIEIGIDAMPDHILNRLSHAYYTAGIIEFLCQWGSIAGVIIWTSALLYLQQKTKQEHPVLVRNVSGQDKLLQESG